MSDRVERSLAKLIAYCEKKKFKGYDPYDVQNSFFPISRLPHFFKFAITQVNKRSPLNFRPLLGIRNHFHTKAMGLFLAGYCNLFKVFQEQSFLKKTEFFLNWIKDNTSLFSQNTCWGFDYDYASRSEEVKKGFPTVVHHSYVIQSLYKLYLLTGQESIATLIRSSERFILKNIPMNRYKSGICFGYHPCASGCCYNANLHAAECLAIIDRVNNSDDHFNLVKKAVQYVGSRQKHSGEWYYSHGTNIDKEKKQIDFHQGFVLDCLRSINHLYHGKLDPIVMPAIHKGLEFYYSEQFDHHGMGLFRYPQKYPADIHNQAQGIITFSRFSDFSPKYAKMTETILNWTIENMQDQEGYFYYQKYKFITNKISYMRWAQAWMFFAMSEFLMVKRCGLEQ